jgi:hypothetical protein
MDHVLRKVNRSGIFALFTKVLVFRTDPGLLPFPLFTFDVFLFDATLNGRRTPVIERVEAPPNNLGMGFCGFLDVGLKEQDPRGAVKVKGEV